MDCVEHKENDRSRCSTTRQQVIDTLHAQHEQLRQFGVRKIGLFGSVAQGSDGPQSDVDMVVEFSETTYRRFIALKSFLESILGRKVDLLTPDAVEGRLKAEIEKNLIDVPT